MSASPVSPITTIRFGGFSILAPLVLEWAAIEGTLYLTDGKRTWEFREILPMTVPDTKKN